MARTSDKPMGGYKIIRVTRTDDYLLPMNADGTTHINGWTPEECATNWFNEYSLNSSHATRDSYRIGNGSTLIGWTIEELKK
jgi:hypothetical protein